jgi:isocitrate/isopropylmalate dehydrogenase
MSAVVATLADGVRTRDLGGTATTMEYADAIQQRL